MFDRGKQQNSSFQRWHRLIELERLTLQGLTLLDQLHEQELSIKKEHPIVYNNLRKQLQADRYFRDGTYISSQRSNPQAKQK